MFRWIKQYEQEAQERLESKPAVNWLVEEIERLTTLEQRARTAAGETTNDRHQQSWLGLALRCARQRQSLLVETGVIPRDATRIHQVIGHVPDSTSRARDERTNDEVREDIEKLLRHARKL